MSDTETENLREFVEELESMARHGQSLSIVSGFHLAWWGAVIAIASFLNMSSILYALPFGGELIWPALIGIGWFGGRLLQRKLNRSTTSGLSTFANRVTAYVWTAIGFIGSFIVIAEGGGYVDFSGRGYFIIFMMCGLGLTATAAAGHESLLLLSGVGWFGVGIASLFFAPAAHFIYGITVVSCLIFLVLPGVIIAVRNHE